MVNSRAKGARAERELARKLKELFGVNARRGQQFCGANGDADVVGIPGVHIEAKRVEHLNLSAAFEQSQRDAKTKNEIPVVIHRKTREPWMVTLRLDDLKALVKTIQPFMVPQEMDSEETAQDVPESSGSDSLRAGGPNQGVPPTRPET